MSIPHLPNSLVATNIDTERIGAHPMIKHYGDRAWKLALTVGPLAVIALSLVAGFRWK